MSKTRIPETMTVAALNAHDGVEALSIEQRPVPKPGKNDVQVKVVFSPSTHRIWPRLKVIMVSRILLPLFMEEKVQEKSSLQGQDLCQGIFLVRRWSAQVGEGWRSLV